MKQAFIQSRFFVQTFFWGFIFVACFASVLAQQPNGTLIPTVCIESYSASGTTTLTANTTGPFGGLRVANPIPLFATMVINPGGANQESILAIYNDSPTSLSISTYRSGFGSSLQYSHTAGETVNWSYNGAKAYFGYDNTSSTAINLPAGILTDNYFHVGSATYPGYNHATYFQPGKHQRVFSLNVPTTFNSFAWYLNGNRVYFTLNSPPCSTINYQGRLANAGAAANGNYDFRFTLYNAASGGAAQSETLTTPNVAVSNGVFTAQLNFGPSLFGKNAPRFLEIAVRPASQNANDPYTVLTPRQPITDIPFAVNAQTAFSVAGGLVQLSLTNGAPQPFECTEATRGQTRVDSANALLYVCVAAGWKSTALQ